MTRAGRLRTDDGELAPVKINAAPLRKALNSSDATARHRGERLQRARQFEHLTQALAAEPPRHLDGRLDGQNRARRQIQVESSTFSKNSLAPNCAPFITTTVC